MKKIIDYHNAYVTCLTCDVCYDQHGLPTFCQNGIHIDPRAVLDNMERAANCKEWFPKQIGRRNAGKEYTNQDRWYEKDSMA